MFLTPEEKQIGIENFNAAVGSKPLRRDFLVQAFKDELRSGKGLGSRYFGYGDSVAEPVRVGVIGTGDEGCVLIGAINPNFIAVKSIADIRPYNIWRAFNGDHYSDAALKYRPGLMKVFGWKTEDEARKNVKTYGDYMELIANAKADGVEAVIIALPLHLHAPAAVAAMRAGLHVLTEKLMGHSVRECKEMARTAKETDLLLATGHQRHYNILYDDAVDMIRKRLLGDLHYIRAQWHRGNLPGKDSWQQPMPRAVKPDDPLANDLDHKLRSWSNTLESLKLKKHRDVPRWEKKVAQVRAQIEDAVVDAAKFDYRDMELKDASGNTIYVRPAIEELLRWRLWDRTGGGLMAELGSHQLDAAGIFIHAMHQIHNPQAEKPRPLAVAASAGRPLFPPDREVEDHVYCVMQFPAPDYDPADPNNDKKKIGVQYASINGNGFGGYGEAVFGTEGTLLLEREQDALLYRTNATTDKTRVVVAKGGDRKGLPTLQIYEEGDPESRSIGTLGTLPAERGYTEQLEHWAWCIRNRAQENLPRCHPKVALGDAVIALVTNIAAREGRRIDFKTEWFDPDNDETPEGVKPDLSRYNS